MWSKIWRFLWPIVFFVNSGFSFNTSDVFMVGGHAEADRAISYVDDRRPMPVLPAVMPTPVEITPVKILDAPRPQSQPQQPQQPKPQRQPEKLSEDTVFVPNEDKPEDDDRYTGYNDRTVDSLLQGQRSIADTLVEPRAKPKEKEPMIQEEGIFFVSGKNNDRSEEDSRRQDNRKGGKKHINEDKAYKPDNRRTPPKLDCANPQCNVTQDPVCGGKVDNKSWKYRLFMNECFLNRVNCGFKFDNNKYMVVEMENCAMLGGHDYPPARRRSTYRDKQEEEQNAQFMAAARRSFSSRRSMNMDRGGHLCGHGCPIACLEDYNPICAISSDGTKKVFVNHCKLDFHSCLMNVAWRTIPLAECVGQKTADFRQNRGFIGWLQRMGVIDTRGRLIDKN